MDERRDDPEDSEGLVEAAHALAGARRVTALTGAGISTDSGIPDFRGPEGVWTKDPEAERLATIEAYLAEPEVRRRAWQNRLESPTWRAEPNAGHRALVSLERQGRLVALITQNIDGLHQKAGTSEELVVELHGTLREVVCLACGDRHPAARTLERVAAGEQDPRCLVVHRGRRCGGILKSATISFGQRLVPEDLEAAEEAVVAADLLLVVGSSLGVYPAAGLVPLAHSVGTPMVIVNAQPTPFDALARSVVRRPISEVLPLLVGDA